LEGNHYHAYISFSEVFPKTKNVIYLSNHGSQLQQPGGFQIAANKLCTIEPIEILPSREDSSTNPPLHLHRAII
jgi:hypothetical protein